MNWLQSIYNIFCYSESRWEIMPEYIRDSCEEVERTLLPKTKAKEAKGLISKISSLETSFVAHFWNVVLERFQHVSVWLQNSEFEL